MRDAERWKDKFELSLDNRQIFFLFFGSAICACLVFVVGVIVGKKLQSRQFKAERAGADSLSLVDRQSDVTVPELTFHSKLIKPDARSKLHVPPEVLEMSDLDPTSGAGAHPPIPLAKADRRPVVPAPGAKAPAVPPRRYTLQVSAFQRRGEAEQMMRRLSKKGYRPYLVSSRIPGRGVWYRVRLGSFGSWNQARSAKKEFEAKAQLTAYISRR